MTVATADERRLLDLINQSRAAEGLAPLVLETHLNASAEAHSRWMLQNDVFSHTGQGGSSATDRIRAAGFDFGTSWGTAENLAYVGIDGDGTLADEIAALHRNLMNSPSHRANILAADKTLIGIGLELGEFDGHRVLIVTQNFARTNGDILRDLAPGVTIADADAPNLFVAGLDRAGWLEDHGGARAGISGGADDLQFGAAANSVNAGGGNDWIAGRGGNDTLSGGAGGDRIAGGTGSDRLAGNDGNDRLSGAAGADALWGGRGADALRGDGGNDRLHGGDWHDRLHGGSGADALYGQGGNDLLRGGGGFDTLSGGAGRDVLEGGTGADRLIGGAGADSFVFRAGDGRDRIADFGTGNDRLLIARDLLGDDPAAFLRDNITDTGGAVRIDFGNGDDIVLEGADLTVAEVADAIFLF